MKEPTVSVLQSSSQLTKIKDPFIAVSLLSFRARLSTDIIFQS